MVPILFSSSKYGLLPAASKFFLELFDFVELLARVFWLMSYLSISVF